jgi:hypothetical protein
MAGVLALELDRSDPDFFPLIKVQMDVARTAVSGSLKVSENTLRKKSAEGVLALLNAINLEKGLPLEEGFLAEPAAVTIQ